MSLPRLPVAAMMMFGSFVFGVAAGAENATVFRVLDVAALPDKAYGRQVRLGRAIIAKTYAYIGPLVADPAKRYAGNNLACGDCHLEAGAKTFGLPLVGLYGDFPRYSIRSGREISIEGRINSCMTCSMNGQRLPVDAPAMRALAAYVKFLSSNMPLDERVPYDRSGQIPELDRAADPIHGKVVYARVCLGCHQGDGAGIVANLKALVSGYVVPPLWGNGSFNDGAGMARIITLANFAYANMPPGVTMRRRGFRLLRPGMSRPMSSSATSDEIGTCA